MTWYLKCPSFSLVPFMDVDQMVGVLQVQFGKHSGIVKGTESRVHKRQRILVLPSNVIQTSVVNARPEGLVLLHKEPCTHRRG